MVRQSFDFTIVLKCFAALLIINSHSNALYPEGYSALATGGAIGNALFFFLSGYGISLSNLKVGFWKWIYKRFIRIYPATWVFMLLCNLIGIKYEPIDFLITPYWFVNAIIVFYVLYYFIKCFLSSYIKVVCCVLMIMYIVNLWIFNDLSQYVVDNTRNSTLLHWFYYFAIMLFGSIFANDYKIIRAKKISFLCLLLFVAVYYICKAVIFKSLDNVFISGFLQSILPFFLFFIIYFFVNVVNTIKKIPINIRRFVDLISGLTLETYIVQFVIIDFFSELDIDMKLLLSYITILIVAYLLNKVTIPLRNVLKKVL